jgi:hypothetical protein
MRARKQKEVRILLRISQGFSWFCVHCLIFVKLRGFDHTDEDLNALTEIDHGGSEICLATRGLTTYRDTEKPLTEVGPGFLRFMAETSSRIL